MADKIYCYRLYTQDGELVYISFRQDGVLSSAYKSDNLRVVRGLATPAEIILFNTTEPTETILVTNQSNSSLNGIYTVSGSLK